MTFSYTANRSLTAALLLSTMTAYSLMAQAQTRSSDSGVYVDEIIVTGSPLTRSVDEAITGVSVLTGDELASRLALTLGETLKSEPGVSSTSFGAGASRPLIRGQGGDRVRVLNNGVGSIDASSASPDHAVAAEPAQAERIEVLRGAALLRYGSSGAGGVVNVIDGRIPDRLPDKIEGAARAGVTTVDGGWEAAGSVDIPLGNFVLHLDGTTKSAGDYDIPGFAESAALRAAEEAEAAENGAEEDGEEEAFGTVENSFVETDALTGGLSFIGERGFLGFAVSHFTSDYGVPGGHEEGEEEDGAEEEEEEENVTIGLEQTRIDINGSLETDGFIEKFVLFGGYADYSHTEFEAPGEVGTVFTNEGFELRLEAIQRERGGWKAAHGVQVRNRDFAAIGEEAFVPSTTTEQYGVYSFHQTELGDLHLEGAARFEHTNQENAVDGSSRSFNALSLSAGGDIHLTDAIRLGGTVFRTQRAPTTEELYSDGPHLATDQFERGDPSLGLERATGIEAAFRHREDGHFITANLFYTDYDNYIFERGTGEIEDGLDVFEFTAEDASFAGFEIQAGAQLAEIGSFEVKGDALAEFVRAKTDTGNLPRIPPLSILTGIEAQNERYKLRGEIDYAAAQNKVSGVDSPTQSYTLVNLFADWRLSEAATISVSALNLFDDEARQHSSFLKELVPLPGRNIRFAIRTTF
jgi:iron complex outermembrane receptor protein